MVIDLADQYTDRNGYSIEKNMTRAFCGMVRFLPVKVHIWGLKAHYKGGFILSVSTSMHAARAWF